MSEAKECVAVSESPRPRKLAPASFRGLGLSLTANSHTVHGTDKAGGRTHGSHCDGQGPGRRPARSRTHHILCDDSCAVHYELTHCAWHRQGRRPQADHTVMGQRTGPRPKAGTVDDTEWRSASAFWAQAESTGRRPARSTHGSTTHHTLCDACAKRFSFLSRPGFMVFAVSCTPAIPSFSLFCFCAAVETAD